MGNSVFLKSIFVLFHIRTKVLESKLNLFAQFILEMFNFFMKAINFIFNINYFICKPHININSFKKDVSEYVNGSFQCFVTQILQFCSILVGLQHKVNIFIVYNFITLLIFLWWKFWKFLENFILNISFTHNR